MPLNFLALEDPSGLSNLDHAKLLIAKGHHLDADYVQALKAGNPDWRDHPVFVEFDIRSDGGRWRPRGRPRATKFQGREWIADAFHKPVYRLVRLKRSNDRFSEWLIKYAAYIGNIDPNLSASQIAAEALCNFFKLPFSPDRYLARRSARNVSWKNRNRRAVAPA